LVSHQRPADGCNVILPRERLLGIFHAATRIAGLVGILNREAGIQSSRAIVESAVAMPLVTSPLGCNHNRTRGRPTAVGVRIGGANGEFLDAVGREVL